MEVAEFDSETVAEMDAELNAISSGDEQATEDLQRTSIQAIYWIMVHRKEAGIPMKLTHSSPFPQIIAMHKWLIKQPLSFLPT